MTREEAIERLELCQNVCNDCLTCASHDEALEMAIAALRAEEGAAKLSEFLQEKLGEQESGSCKNCTDQGNCFQKGNGWVSVEDRLPEPLVDVLAWDSNWGEAFTAFMTRPNEWVGVVCSRTVTHWMPLPEGPEVEV